MVADSFYIYLDDDFTNAPLLGDIREDTYPTTPGGAGSTTGVGNGWIDEQGGLYHISSSNVLTVQNSLLTNPDSTSAFLNRPHTELYTVQQAIITFPVGYMPDGSTYPYVAARFRIQPNGDYYMLAWNYHLFLLFKYVGGTLSEIDNWNIFLTTGHQYRLTFNVGTPSGTVTPCYFTIYDLTVGNDLGTINASPTEAALVDPGYFGLVSWVDSNGGQDAQVLRVQLYQGDVPPDPTLTVNPSTANVITGVGTVSITPTLTASENPLTASLSGLGSLSTTSPANNTPFTYTPPGSGIGSSVVTVFDTGTDAVSTTCTIFYGPPPSTAVLPTSVTLGVSTPVTLTGTNTGWTGGTKPTVSGGNAVGFGNVVVSGQTISAYLNPGSQATTLTIGNTTDGTTASISAVSAPAVNIFFQGDMFTSSDQNNLTAPRLATIMSGLGPIAQGGLYAPTPITLETMFFSASSISNNNFVEGMINILVAQGGHNDYYNGGSFGITPADVENRVAAYVAAILAEHPWLIVWSLEPPCSNPAYPPNFDAMRTESNTWIENNWESLGIAALSTPNRDSRIGLDGCEQNPTYFNNDLTTLTTAGYTIWGQYDLAACLQAIAFGNSLDGVGGGSLSGQRSRRR